MAREWSINDGPRRRLVISAHERYITSLACLPDGRVVTGSNDGFAKVWNMENGMQEGDSIELHREIDEHRTAVTQDGTKIISAGSSGKIKVWDVASHTLAKEWTHRKTLTNEIAISPDGLIALGKRNVVFYTIEGRKTKYAIKVGKFIESMSFSPDGNKLACGTFNGLHVYDVRSGRPLFGPSSGYTRGVTCACVLWSHDGRTLFSAYDNTIRRWNCDTGEQLGHSWTGHSNEIHSFSLSPDESILASASWDDTVRFWDATSGEPVEHHLGHDQKVTRVCFSPAGESVVSAGSKGKIYLWRVPWLDSVEGRVSMLLRWTSVFALISLSHRQALPASTRRTTPWKVYNHSSPRIHHILCTFPLLNKCWISILA